MLQETAARLSAALSGLPKSAEHREAISVAQRRRITVTGILRAVESVHSAEQASASYATRAAGRCGPLCPSSQLLLRAFLLRAFPCASQDVHCWH